jgi:sulfite reductase beta subunit-like hemoprotein
VRPDLGLKPADPTIGELGDLTCTAMTNMTRRSSTPASRNSATRSRRLAGEITEDQFKPLRLMNGLYLQLHAYMLRVAIPYGTLSRPADAHAGAHRAQI